MPISLKAARVNAGYTQSNAAKMLGISTKTIQNWESGKTLPNSKRIKSLCELYNTCYDDIFFDL